MKPTLYAFSILALLLSLNGCRVPGKQPPNVGPFDSRGNYVEAWADDPSKWRAYTPKDVAGDPPTIAKNEQPPENSVPLAPGNSPSNTRVVASHPPKPDSARTVATYTPKPKPDSERAVARTTTKAKPDSERAVARTTTKPKSSSSRVVKSSSKPKAKSSVAKAKPKAKTSSTVRHTVKKGDSLSSIAAKHGTTVAALKKANGISGTLIRDGKTLVIPKRK